jgi:hypothetical protein
MRKYPTHDSNMEIVREFLNCILNINYWNFGHIYFPNALFAAEISSLLRVYSMLGTQEQREIAENIRFLSSRFYTCISLEKEILHTKSVHFIRVSVQICLVSSLSPKLDRISWPFPSSDPFDKSCFVLLVLACCNVGMAKRRADC